MASNRSDLLIRIGASIRGLRKGLKDAERAMQRTGRKLEGIGRDLTTRVSLPLLGIGAAAVKAFGDFEKLEKGLTAIAGSSEAAEKQLDRLRKIALQPGINLQQAVRGSINLQAVAFSAEEAERTVSALAKAVTVTGGSATELQSVVRQFTQINAKGRILQEDLSIIQESAPAVGFALQDAFGTKNIEAIRKTGISARDFTLRLTEAIEKGDTFQNVTGGIANAFDNFRQAVTASLVELGKEIDATIDLQAALDKVVGFIQRLIDGFKALNPETRKFIIIAAGVAAAIGPVIVGIGAFIRVLAFAKVALLALTSPIGLIVTGLSVFAGWILSSTERTQKFQAALVGLGAVAKRVAETVVSVFADITTGIALAAAGNPAAAAASFAQGLKKTLVNSAEDSAESYIDTFSSAFSNALKRIKDKSPEVEEAVESFIPSADFNFDDPSFTPGGGGITKDALKLLRSKELKRLNREGYISPEALDITKQRVTSLAATAIGAGEVIATAMNLSPIFEDASEGIFEIEGRLFSLSDALEKIREGGFGVLAEAALGAADAMAAAASSGEASFKKLGQAALSGAADIVRANLIKAVTSFAADAFQKLGIFGVILAATAPAVVGGLFNKVISAIGIPRLAKGGIIPPGFPNDTFPALLSSGERVLPAVRPLSGMGDLVIAETRISGSDLRIILKRAEQQDARIAGR